ncbi:hypothetical protein CCACVL1_06904, partial [Corchorus capsularis]
MAYQWNLSTSTANLRFVKNDHVHELVHH